jgi:hypothetical protein
LVGEGGYQLDLLLCERLDPLARHDDDADRRAFAQQRHAKLGTGPTKCRRFGQRVCGICRYIGDLNCASLRHHPAGERSCVVRSESMVFEELPIF